MRVMFLLILIAGVAGLSQEIQTNSLAALVEAKGDAPAADKAEAKVAVLEPAPVAVETNTYARLVRQEVELAVKFKLLRELADEHALRSEQQADAGKVESARWESDRAGELRSRGNALLIELNDTAAQRLSLETAIRPALGGPVEERKLFNYDELAYLTELDQRLLKLRQALIAATQAGHVLQSELQTNRTDGSVLRITELIELNTRTIGQLEKEQSDLELQRLQFRALRR